MIATRARYAECEDHVRNGRDAQAIPLLRSILAENPRDAGAQMLLGQALLHLGRAREALEPMLANLELRGSWYGVHLHLGLAYDHLGETEPALEHFRAAVTFEPGLKDVLGRIIWLLESTGRGDEAAPYKELYLRCQQYESDPNARSFRHDTLQRRP